jgi:hypothetical protein
VVHRTVAVPGATEVNSLAVGGNGLVYGLTTGAILFTYDPDRREIVQREDLSTWGQPVRSGLVAAPEGAVYGLLSHCVFGVDARTGRPGKRITLPQPATAGLALHDGHLYYAVGAQLWRCRV